MPDFDLDAFLPYRLAVLSSRVSRSFADRYRDSFGLSIPEWRVIAHLSQTEEPVSVREIHTRVDMDKSKVSRAATRLEDAGIITKSENASDRRLISLALTDKGHALVAEIIPIAADFERDLLDSLSPGARDGLNSAIDVLLKGTEP